MLQKVIRKELSGGIEAFDFEIPIRSFCVKNFSTHIAYCSFENNTEQDKCVRIDPGFAEIFYYNASNPERHTKIYVDGDGTVEVEAIDW